MTSLRLRVAHAEVEGRGARLRATSADTLQQVRQLETQVAELRSHFQGDAATELQQAFTLWGKSATGTERVLGALGDLLTHTSRTFQTYDGDAASALRRMLG